MSLALNEYILDDIINITSNKVDTKNLVLQQYISTENMLPDRKGICLAASMPSGKVNQFLKNDTLFSNIRTYFRKVWFASFDGGSSPDVLIFRTKDVEVLDPRFLYYLISDQKFIDYSDKTSKGAKMPRGDKSAILNYKTYLPTLSVQKRISKILSDLDDKIYLNNQTNQTLESIAQAIFKSWFIDFDPVRAKIAAKQEGKDPELAAMCAISGKSETELEQMAKDDFAELQATAALFPAELMESELGKVPNGWLPVNIEYFIELIYGKALKKTERIHGVYPVYGSGGLTGWHNKALVKGPGVIIGRKGTIGSIFLENKDFYPIDTTYYVKTKNNCSLLFAYYLLQTLGLEKMNTDAAVPGLNRQNFYHLEVPFYPSDLIEKYTKTIENIISKNLSIKKENEYLIGMRDSLLPKLLSGEVALGDVIILYHRSHMQHHLTLLCIGTCAHHVQICHSGIRHYFI